MSLDIDFVRNHFPAFSHPLHQDQSFFENAGGSFACEPVIDRLHRFYSERKVQPYGPIHGQPTGRRRDGRSPRAAVGHDGG